MRRIARGGVAAHDQAQDHAERRVGREVAVADDGRVLVSGPDLRSPPGRQRMRVFSPEGELLGVADLPPVAIHELGENHLLGVWRNDDGVEFVVLHDVRRP